MKLKKRSLLYSIYVLSCSFIFFSCTHTGVFEKNTTIPKYEWKSNFAVSGSFSIADTAALYNTYIVLRHTDAYKYNNIWINLGIQVPGGTMQYRKVDLSLATDANGWMGSGMNDIWEVRQLLPQSILPLHQTGTYTYNITQIMRDDPLPAVMSAGLRVEKQANQ
jgi:gliding motility-associated lipoprotein GldH